MHTMFRRACTNDVPTSQVDKKEASWIIFLEIQDQRIQSNIIGNSMQGFASCSSIYTHHTLVSNQGFLDVWLVGSCPAHKGAGLIKGSFPLCHCHGGTFMPSELLLSLSELLKKRLLKPGSLLNLEHARRCGLGVACSVHSCFFRSERPRSSQVRLQLGRQIARSRFSSFHLRQAPSGSFQNSIQRVSSTDRSRSQM